MCVCVCVCDYLKGPLYCVFTLKLVLKKDPHMVIPLDKILTKKVFPFMMKHTLEMIFCLMWMCQLLS